MKIKFLLVIACSLLFRDGMQAQVLDLIRGFDATEDAVGSGIYTFCPRCADAPPDTGSHPCGDVEVHGALLEWSFSETDYSVDSKPKRKFSSPNVTVRLRPTGLKEDERTGCIAGSGTCTYRRAIAGAEWVIQKEWEKQFTQLDTASNPRFVAEEYASLFSTSDVEVKVGAPYCAPVIGAEVIYPVIFRNPTKCEYTFDHISFENIVIGPGGIAINSDVGCEDFARSGSMSCFNEVRHLQLPVSPPRQVWFSRVGHFRSNPMTSGFTLLPRSSRVVLVAAEIPNNLAYVGWTNKLRVHAHCMPSKSLASCSMPNGSELDASRNDIVVESIDPNQKWIVNPQASYRNGEMITFAIKFKNTGIGDEDMVYVEDLFPNILDGNAAQFLDGVIFHADGAGSSPLLLASSNLTTVVGGSIYRMQFDGAGTTSVLRPGDSAVVRLRVPVVSPLPLGWAGDSAGDTLRDTFVNRAFTKFSHEHRIHEAKSVSFVVEQVVSRAPLILWVFGAILAALIAFTVVSLRRRLRKPRPLPSN